jgi:tetraacyldisaccharide 4'-kinase
MLLREPAWWSTPSQGGVARLLLPLGFVYGSITARRMAQPPRYRSPLPVICVGNFTAGGTGKTPATLLIARLLLEAGGKPVVVSRGYGGRLRGPHLVDPLRDDAAAVGDEPLLLAQCVPTFIARDRVAGARAAETLVGTTHVLLDDGLQSPQLAKSLRLAVVDGRRGFGNGAVIPAGPLRASIAAQLPHVDAILLNQGYRRDPFAALVRPPGLPSARPVIDLMLKPASEVEALRGSSLIAFAGIGQPGHFFQMLRDLDLDVRDTVAFADHRPLSVAEATDLLARAQRSGARLVTTEKDRVRLVGLSSAPHRTLADTLTAVAVTLQPTLDSHGPLRSLLGLNAMPNETFPRSAQ